MDNTTRQLLRLLREHLRNEPPADAGHHPSMELQARFGDEWATWDKARQGFELSLGRRLIDHALERKWDMEEETDG